MGARLAALADEQRGVLARWQLRERGWSDSAITWRLRTGALRPVWPGTFAHGHTVLTRDGWLMAATLACGEGSVLSGRAAASARGLLRAWSTIDVVTATKRGVALPGLRAHRARLTDQERDIVRGLPVTSLARTALDVAAREGAERVAELLDEALLAEQYDHAEMVDLLDRRAGCRGVLTLRTAVAGLGDEGVVFRSRPERRARDLIRAAGVPEPRINAWFPTRAGHGHELDLWWPGLGENLELDGPRHRLPHQRRLDTLRDADLRGFGIGVTRVPSEWATEAPDRLLDTVRRLVERP